ncbi:MAG: T9SS type A sorting domain-containing protein [Candidatus Krumholzibacteriia bacterium]
MRYPFCMLRRPFMLARAILFAGPFLYAASAAVDVHAVVVSDSLYKANHPGLLLRKSDRGDLRARLRDGGDDDDAYAFIRFMVDDVYPLWSLSALAWNDFGSTTMPMIGIAMYVPKKEDKKARDMGRDLTFYIKDAYDVDFNEANSAFRLRALAIGYDMFMKDTDDALREQIRDEMVSYMQTMVSTLPYEIFMYRPYLANHSAMIAGALGLAAICLRDEVDPVLVGESLARADAIIDSLLTHQFDDDGSYNEGSLYAAWTMRHLVYYFHAREVYDGFRYADHPKIRALERWLAYEVLPEGIARINNINDTSYGNFPLSMNNTYFDWAGSEWNSGLSAWIWEHTSGVYGVDMGQSADKVATALWHRDLTPQQPGTVLPKSKLWKDRGLYNYRSGWQSGASSQDIVFTFYSGKFHGGHAQEDQNQFTLHGYGAQFAIDHGPGSTAKQSEAHSIVLIDGAGQHNAGSSIGTDGRISEFLMNGFADYVQGDASDAYTTHSSFNDPNQPVPGIDWSWGYNGANPVDHAVRNVLAVHGNDAPPYFIITDDIDKDGLPHNYEWRLHTSDQNSIDTTSVPVRISRGSSYLDVYPAGSGLDPLGLGIAPFDNQTTDPNANVLSFTRVAVNPRFAFILIPGDGGTASAEVSRAGYTWGSGTVIDWEGGITDCFVHNPLGRLVTLDLTALRSRRSHRDRREEPVSTSGTGGPLVRTDAVSVLIRFDGSGTHRYIASNVRRLSIDRTDWIRILDGRASCASDGATIDVDREEAEFVLYGPGLADVRYRGQSLAFTRVNGFLRSPVAGGGAAPAAPEPQGVRASVSPNPFNPTTRLTLELGRRQIVRVTVYDVQGRLVARLVNAPLAAGLHVVEWNANAASGRRVVSGVYFMRIETETGNRNIKLTVLK